MQQNKENIPSKIPRLKSSTKTKFCEARCPLRTLNQANIDEVKSTTNEKNKKVKENREKVKRSVSYDAGASTSSQYDENVTQRVPLNMKYVTRRPTYESLDWDLNLLNDQHEDKSIDDKEDTPVNHLAGIGLASTPITPIVKPLENKEVKNIKTSLKRPHSRELQGLSPVESRYKYTHKWIRRPVPNEQSELTPISLLCRISCLDRDCMADMFAYLLSSERKLLEIPKSDNITRACVINWLMKVNGPKGNPAIVQSAAWYLDSILSIYFVPIVRLQLLAAASYWIARKLHGPPISTGRLVRLADNAFNAVQLLAAEKGVLSKLNYPPQPIIPQDFISYLASWSDSTHPEQIQLAATFLYMSGLMIDKKLYAEFPSVLAATAVKDAVMLLGKDNALKLLTSCPLYQAIEKKSTCMESISIIFRSAVRTLASPLYEYRAPLDHFSGPPYYVANKIITYVLEQ